MTSETLDQTEPPEPKPRQAAVRRLVLSNSEMQTFRDCPEKWGFVYVDLLRPKVEGRALAVGHVVHAGLAAGIRTYPKADLAIPAAVNAVDGELAQYLARLADSKTEADEYERLAMEAEELSGLVRFMVTHYFETHAENDARYLVPVLVERAFEVNVPNSLGRRTPTNLGGVLDALYYDTENGDLLLDEHKTCSTHPGSVEKRIEFDPQISGYLFAIQAMAQAGQIQVPGLTPEQVAKLRVGRTRYNVLRKKVPSVPKVNKDETVSVAAIDTLARFYEAALQAQELRGKPRTEAQGTLLERLTGKGDPFLGRYEFFRNEEEIEAWRRETIVQGGRIRAALRDRSTLYRNPGHCAMPWSLSCAMRDVCLNPTDPMVRSTYRVAKDAHEEIAMAKEAEV